MENKNKTALLIAAILILISLAFAGGWFARNKSLAGTVACKAAPLRVSGFKFAKPLLVCDTSAQKDYKDLAFLQKDIEKIIGKEKTANNINDASVYFQDFNTDGRIDINQDEKFSSASIGKVPIMIAVYRLAESNPNFLSERIKDNDTADANSTQEIPPKDYAKLGQTYTVGELVEKMIKHSDNNSLNLLLSFIKLSTLESLYQDLRVPVQYDPEHPENFDFISTKDISYFFRVLYNSTYLTNDLSEKALAILAETDYKNGLVSGVPNGVAVAHKFGLKTLFQGDAVAKRELHDCGIIYHLHNPYLLCVMTKSSSAIPTIENVIKDISAAVYKFEDSR